MQLIRSHASWERRVLPLFSSPAMRQPDVTTLWNRQDAQRLLRLGSPYLVMQERFRCLKEMA